MIYLYSPSTGGFYNNKIHKDSTPPDAIEVSNEMYLSLIAGQSSGKVIQVDGDAISLADRPPSVNTPLQEIIKIETDNPVTHRMLRELTLSVAQIASAVTGKPVEENPTVRDILSLEAQIAVLRQQAKEQGLIP